MKTIFFFMIIAVGASSVINYHALPKNGNGCENNLAVNITIPPLPKVNITIPPLPKVNITIPPLPKVNITVPPLPPVNITIPPLPEINITIPWESPENRDIPKFNVTCNTTAINTHNHTYPYNCILFNTSTPNLRGQLP